MTTRDSNWPAASRWTTPPLICDRSDVAHRRDDAAVVLHDPDRQGIELVAHQPAADPRPPMARSSAVLPGFHPRKLGHVNSLTGDVPEMVRFYCDVLGMRVTDRLGDEGVWLHSTPTTTRSRWSGRAMRTSITWRSS